MSSRRVLKHVDKVIRDQKAAPVAFDHPHFLFNAPADMPAFGDHQICATPYEGHLAEMKLAEWGFAPDAPRCSPSELDLVPQSGTGIAS